MVVDLIGVIVALKVAGGDEVAIARRINRCLLMLSCPYAKKNADSS